MPAMKSMKRASLIWLAFTAAYGWYYVETHAGIPNPELYTMSRSFQLFAFIWMRGPLLVSVLATVLVWIFWRGRKQPN